MTDSDDEALFASLEKEDDTSYRDARIQQLNEEFASKKNNHSTNPNPGSTTLLQNEIYPTLSTDQSVLDFTTRTSRCLVHFAHPDFTRCAVMDMRLGELASVHYEVSFARVDVRNTPFIAQKLGIRILPCVIGFKDGVGVDRVVGFEGLEARGFDGVEGFEARNLEKRLVAKGVLLQAKLSGGDDDDDIRDEDSGDDEGARRTFRRIKGKRGIRSANPHVRSRGDDDDGDWD
ncbi:hypothetical protein PENARI_c023G10743 [Penicillium arizonense]|jgi:hypothetical protein|uniref:Thioredoxin domain-containing protein n=1 Tax=Penicillium arizonense TaxID=1835702 RepID=A0A1F5L7H5_PENAI|nr:hypothetical protein PENARI_c023G10743 [Penicillium arizonense]OGE49188.1 hypothetical protein PENARI_c023G10743 [Penicillium arizonense]